MSGVIVEQLEVLYHLPVLIDRAFKCLILRALTHYIIAREVVEKQKTLEIVELQHEIPDRTER